MLGFLLLILALFYSLDWLTTTHADIQAAYLSGATRLPQCFNGPQAIDTALRYRDALIQKRHREIRRRLPQIAHDTLPVGWRPPFIHLAPSGALTRYSNFNAKFPHLYKLIVWNACKDTIKHIRVHVPRLTYYECIGPDEKFHTDSTYTTFSISKLAPGYQQDVFLWMSESHNSKPADSDNEPAALRVIWNNGEVAPQSVKLVSGWPLTLSHYAPKFTRYAVVYLFGYSILPLYRSWQKFRRQRQFDDDNASA